MYNHYSDVFDYDDRDGTSFDPPVVFSLAYSKESNAWVLAELGNDFENIYGQIGPVRGYPPWTLPTQCSPCPPKTLA